MILTATINEVKRRITFDNPQAVVAVKGDYEVNGVAFAFPAIYEDDFDLSTAVKTVYYKATDGIIYNHVVTDTDTDTGYPLWVFKDEINKGAFGDVEFALVCDKVEGGNIVKRWVSMITTFRVQRSIEIDESEQEDNEQTYSERLAYLMTQMANMQVTVSGLASGAPTPVSLASAMTDTSKLYVYTGSESGYTAGHWYYYNGSAWADGGQYGGTSVDPTLTVSGAAADAKVTGDKIAEIKEDLKVVLPESYLMSIIMCPDFTTTDGNRLITKRENWYSTVWKATSTVRQTVFVTGSQHKIVGASYEEATPDREQLVDINLIARNNKTIFSFYVDGHYTGTTRSSIVVYYAKIEDNTITILSTQIIGRTYLLASKHGYYEDTLNTPANATHFAIGFFTSGAGAEFDVAIGIYNSKNLDESSVCPVLTSMVADTNLSVNNLRIYNGALYKVTVPIANGGTLTVGTNVELVTLGELITALLNNNA